MTELSAAHHPDPLLKDSISGNIHESSQKACRYCDDVVSAIITMEVDCARKTTNLSAL
jgi:hypothetical protein